MIPNIKLVIIVVVIAAVIFGAAAIVFLPASFPAASAPASIRIKILPGQNLKSIAGSLYTAGVIHSEALFEVYAVLSGQENHLQSGIYRISPNATMVGLVHALALGLSDNINIVVPEGSNINAVDAIFARVELTKPGAFLKPAVLQQEGYLFPDTYKFSALASVSADEIVTEMDQNFTSHAAQFAEFQLSPLQWHDTVTTASILEKEVRDPKDMGLVSGIIQNRIARHMPLQIDAIVAYGACYPKFVAGKSCEVSQVNIIKAIATKGPYNSYKNQGLPPGPISNPGLNALNAALHPTPSDYLYYLTDRNGVMHYSKTAAEHAANRRKYLGL